MKNIKERWLYQDLLVLILLMQGEILSRQWQCNGIKQNINLTFRELRKLFKKRCLAMLPEKHPTVPNAHSKFEEVITAFVQVKSHRMMISYLFQQLIGHLKSSGDNITTLMPGEIFVSNFQCSIQLQSNAGNAWKKAIRSVPTNIPLKDRDIGATYNILFRQTYPDVIVGSQKQSQNLNMKVT